MNRGQVFAEAKDPTGKWGFADIFDLDEESFRAWVVERLWRAGHVVCYHPSDMDDPKLEYHSRVPHED